MMRFLVNNLKYILTLFCKVTTVIFSILSFFLTVFPFFSEKSLKDWQMCNSGKIAICICGFILLFMLSLGVAIFIACRKNKNTIWALNESSLSLLYGDIFNLKVSRGEKNKRKYVVIPVDTQFMVQVDEDSQNVKHPCVSPNTLHGKFIEKFYKGNESCLDKEIDDFIKIKGYKNLNNKSLPRNRYPLGTVVQITPDQSKPTSYLLLAFSEFDKRNHASCTREQFVDSIRALMKFYDENCQGGNLYIPLMGTNFSRLNISEEESLRIIRACVEIHEDCIRGSVNIVVHQKSRKNVSIFK